MVAALVGSLAMILVCIYAPLPAQITAVGGTVSILVGLFLTYARQESQSERDRAQLLERLQIPFALARQHGFFEQYHKFAAAISKLAKRPDPLLRELALVRLQSLSEEIENLAAGTIVFTATESWRTAYQKVLESLNVKSYYSVAWVRTSAYWNDPPGRQSMRLNYDLVARGFRIERILILPDELWPFEERLPSPEIRPWIEEQQKRGIRVSLVRESDLADEPQLLCDFGIYGDRAVGVQELDEKSRTARYLLCFDQQSRRRAHDRWERLGLYARNHPKGVSTSLYQPQHVV